MARYTGPSTKIARKFGEPIFGADRNETSYKVADALKAELGIEKFDDVIVATGKEFADALSGSYLAFVKNAPILLTNGQEENVEKLQEYIKENLRANGTVYILGGDSAVSLETEKLFVDYQVKRLFGQDRYVTNLHILEEAEVAGGEIVVSTGKEFADGLSASAVKRPVLLVKDTLSAEQRAFLENLSNVNFVLVGGDLAVSSKMEKELADFGEVKRIFGENRYETSVAIAEYFFQKVDVAVIASAKKHPDGLCGGVLAAAMNAPLLLTADDQTGVVADYIQTEEIKKGYVLGGTGTLGDTIISELFK